MLQGGGGALRGGSVCGSIQSGSVAANFEVTAYSKLAPAEILNLCISLLARFVSKILATNQG
jgi:hypothetical protein